MAKEVENVELQEVETVEVKTEETAEKKKTNWKKIGLIGAGIVGGLAAITGTVMAITSKKGSNSGSSEDPYDYDVIDED